MKQLAEIVQGWPRMPLNLDDAGYENLTARTVEMLTSVLRACEQLAVFGNKGGIDTQTVDMYIRLFGLEKISAFPAAPPAWLAQQTDVAPWMRDMYSELEAILTRGRSEV